MHSKLSIKDLERLSGIKAHTIRIWEQRYGVLTPQRTTTNIRWYSHEELKTLLNVCLLYNNGFKISKIARLNPAQLAKEVVSVSKQQLSETDQINSLIIAMIEMDEDRFEAVMAYNITYLGFVAAIEKVIYPFLVKTGVMWLTNDIYPAQEHFISNLIRQKIIVALDNLPKPAATTAKKVICFLPEGELHELSLLFSTYLLREKGFKCTYIGQSVPFSDLKALTGIIQPDYLVSIFTTPFKEYSTQAFIYQLARQFKAAKILLSGSQLFLQKVTLPANVTVFNTPTEIVNVIEAI